MLVTYSAVVPRKVHGTDVAAGQTLYAVKKVICSSSGATRTKTSPARWARNSPGRKLADEAANWRPGDAVFGPKWAHEL